MFWSAGEDGLVLQHDLRDPGANPNVRTVLISLLGLNTSLECKCVYVNPSRPWYIAVGASDHYARVFDRRMLTPKRVDLPESASMASWQRLVEGQAICGCNVTLFQVKRALQPVSRRERVQTS